MAITIGLPICCTYICVHTYIFLCRSDSFEYLEVFVTVGSIEMSLYAKDVTNTQDPKWGNAQLPEEDNDSDAASIPLVSFSFGSQVHNLDQNLPRVLI